MQITELRGNMAAPKGNQFWKARAKHGRDKIFKTPDIMFEAACEYFQWCEDNPLNKAIVYQGVVTGQESLLRAMTIKGLCIFLHVNSVYFNKFESELNKETDEGKDFCKVINAIKEIIEIQKFEGASAGLLNPNIIARDLGLSDKINQEVTGKDGGPVEVNTFNFIPVKSDG